MFPLIQKFVAGLVFVVAAAQAAPTSPNHRMATESLGTSAGNTASANYKLRATLGGAAVGNASDGIDRLAPTYQAQLAGLLAGSPQDFNDDGRPDLVWSNAGVGSTYVWYMNGPALTADAFVASIDPLWKVQGVADFNGDGYSDLLWRNTANGNTYLWYMNGSVLAYDVLLFSLPPQWVIQGVADFNADGKPDLLMRNTESGVAFAWFFDNAAPIGDQFLFGVDPSWKVEQVGDMNGDGQPDLLFRNMGSGLAFAWYTQYAAGSLSLGSSSQPVFSIDPAWEIVQLTDWNGDGDPDLVFRNRDTGVVFVWYLSGTTLGTSDFVIQIDPAWEIVPRR